LKDALLPKRLAGVASSANGSHPAWRLSFLDLDHAGGWSWQVSPADLREIISFLSEMERLTWTEVHAQITSSKRGSHRKHHPMPIGQLCHVRFETGQHGRELTAEAAGGTGDHDSAARGRHRRPFQIRPSHS
jgi:hypothetical protein